MSSWLYVLLIVTAYVVILAAGFVIGSSRRRHRRIAFTSRDDQGRQFSIETQGYSPVETISFVQMMQGKEQP